MWELFFVKKTRKSVCDANAAKSEFSPKKLAAWFLKYKFPKRI
jgi:hypothetical protein